MTPHKKPENEGLYEAAYRHGGKEGVEYVKKSMVSTPMTKTNETVRERFDGVLESIGWEYDHDGKAAANKLFRLVEAEIAAAREQAIKELYGSFQPFLARYSLDRPIPPSELRYFLDAALSTSDKGSTPSSTP